MSPLEPSHPATVGPEIWNIAETQAIFSFINLTDVLKDEMKKKCKEIQKNTNNLWKEMNKTVQCLKAGTASLKKIQTEGNLEMENLEIQTGA